MTRHHDTAAVLRAITEACAQAGGMRPWAALHGLDEATVRGALAKRRAVSKALAAAVGFERVAMFRRKP